MGVLGDPFDLPNSSGLATIGGKNAYDASFPVAHWPYRQLHLAALANVAVNTIECLDHSKLRLCLICGSLRVFAGDLRKFVGVLRSKWVRFPLQSFLGFAAKSATISRISSQRWKLRFFLFFFQEDEGPGKTTNNGHPQKTDGPMSCLKCPVRTSVPDELIVTSREMLRARARDVRDLSIQWHPVAFPPVWFPTPDRVLVDFPALHVGNYVVANEPLA